MRFLVCVSALLLVVGGATALKCYECDECHKEMADSKDCDSSSEVCLKFSMGSRVMKTCAREELCSLNKFQKTFDSYWNKISSAFGSSSSEKSEPLLHCCKGDYCNASDKTVGSLAVLIPSLLSLLSLKFLY